MPSDEELKKARDEERADGFGQYLDGDWWMGQHGKGEQTVLESGTALRHHVKGECSGNCCLHGTSTHGSCRMPRQWRHDKQIIEHVCPHGVGHPCYAGVDYATSKGQETDAVHGCDGCCVEVDNDPFVPLKEDPALANAYNMMQIDSDIEVLNEAIGWVQNDIEKLQDQMQAYKIISILSLVSVIAFIALAVAFTGATQ